jgi:hypothetical protein
MLAAVLHAAISGNQQGSGVGIQVYSIIMPCRCAEGFVTKAEPTKQRD